MSQNKLKLTLPQKVFIVKAYYRLSENLVLVRQEFADTYKMQATNEIISRMVEIFEHFGCIGCTARPASFEIDSYAIVPTTIEDKPEEIFIEAEDIIEFNLETDSGNNIKVENLVPVDTSMDYDDVVSDNQSVKSYTTRTHKTKAKTKATKPKAKDKFLCIICKKTYNNSTFKSHMRKHDKDEATYKCRICGETFEKFLALQIHEEGHIPESEYQFECETCNEKYVSQEKLDYHQKDHLQNKTYICEWCGMIFAKQDSLRVHTRTHTGEKPLQCKVCKASFAFYGSLKAHMKVHSEGSFKCDYCDMMFIYSSARSLHHREQHTGNKPFVCHVCGRACTTAHNLRSHMKILHKLQISLEQIKEQNFIIQGV